MGMNLERHEMGKELEAQAGEPSLALPGEALHGGRVHAYARAMGFSPDQWLDFSANLNPLGPPKGVLQVFKDLQPEWLSAYPDSEAPALRRQLTEKHGALDEHLVLGNGGASLLMLALRASKVQRVHVPWPCFREQPRAIRAAGAELCPLPMSDMRLDLASLDIPKGDALLLTNPHNPTGQLLGKADLSRWIEAYPEVFVIVDEAFMDYVPGESLLPDILNRPKTIILRSLTKFYAMPALRVGYAFADVETAQMMRELQEAWPVGQLEILAAQAALADAEYEQQSIETFKVQAAAFEKVLRDLGWQPYPSAGPYFLVGLPMSGTALARDLAMAGILIRTCATWPGLGDEYIRLAVRSLEDQARFAEALAL